MARQYKHPRYHRVRDDMSICPDSANCVHTGYAGDCCECCGLEIGDDGLTEAQR